MRFLCHGFARAVSPAISVYYRSTCIYSYYLHQANSTELHVRLVLTDSFPMPLLFYARHVHQTRH